MTRGLFREGHHAQVDFDGRATFPVTRSIYEINGYKPLFDDLPTREQYQADNA